MKKPLLVLFMAASFCFGAVAQNQTGIYKTVESSKGASSKRDLLRQELKMNNNEEMRAMKSDKDQLGFTHDKFQHYYKGMKVVGSSSTVHSKGGKATMITGNYREVSDLNLNPTLSSDAALLLARQSTKATKFVTGAESSEDGQLMIVTNTLNGYKARLAYKFHVVSTDRPVNTFIYVDALTGEIVLNNSKIKHADGHGEIHPNEEIEMSSVMANAAGTAATRYSGSQSIITDSNSGSYRLRDYSRGSGILTYDATTANSISNSYIPNGASEYRDNDNNWTSGEHNNSDKDNAALDAHFAAEATYDYFLNTFGRNSYDGNGAVIYSYINGDLEGWLNEPGYNDNAFWGGTAMVYGKGDTYDPLTTVDIAGHEIAHAVCEYSADLVYSYQSGAMNESLSDIWGTCIEDYVNKTYGMNKNIWLLGTEIGGTFRSMSNPNAYGQPDTYLGTSWYSGSQDNGGVHYNSGVGNFWFYTLVTGGSGTNDNGASYSVNAIGIEKAAAIVYRTETVYLTTNSQYADFRASAIQSAIDIYGSGSAEEAAVTNAWHAVGVGSRFVATCNLNAPSNFVASSVGDNGFNLSWNTVSGASNYTVTVGGSSTTVSGTSYTASGLNVATQYTCSVVANCASGSGSISNINVTTTGTAPITYCSSNGNSVADEYIGSVQLNTINNSTGASSGGYADYTSISTSLSASSSYTITVTPTWTGQTYSEGYGVWIDYNQDGDFTDAGETVWTQATSTATSASGSFTVPASAATGSTRMRVTMKYNGTPTSCESFNYGEVEDYTVVIGGATADTQAPTTPGSLTASNVTETTATISWSASSDNVGVTGYNVYQSGSNIGSVTGTSANLTGLTAASNYSFSVAAVDAAGNESAGASVNFTTAGSTADTQAPSAPSSLTASNVGTTSLDLNWGASSDNVGVTSYSVYVNGSLNGTTAGTSYSVSGLTASTTYSLAVSASDAAGNVSSNATTSATTDTPSTGGTTIIMADYFETGWGAWNDGGSDCARVSTSYSTEGSYSIRIRDNSGTGSAMTSDAFNASGYASMNLTFNFHSRSMESGEDFWVRFYNGSSWTTVAAYARGTSFENNNSYTVDLTLSSADHNFASNSQFRIQCDASGNNDQIYVDEVVLTGTSASSFAPNSIAQLPGSNMGFTTREELDLGDAMFYPNPSTGIVKLNSMGDAVRAVKIYGMNGGEVMNVTLAENQKQIDISQLERGLYFVHIVTDEETNVEKLIKQ